MPLYATRQDVADYLHVDPAKLPEDEDLLRQIERASELVDYYTLGKATEGNEAVTKAVCAQLEYWIGTGEETDSGSGDQVRSYSIGSLRIDYATKGDTKSLAPRAYRILMNEGLLYRGVR